MRFGDSVGIAAPCNECISACDSFRCADTVNVIGEMLGGGIIAIILYILIVAIISFLITLGFYLVYKHKKDEHPWKHAFKRSWPWGIAVFLIPIVCVTIVFLIGFFSLRIRFIFSI